ncbi:MAG: hypothetical protein ACYC6L_10730, partial [Anaerolineae bacterium]
ECPLKTRVLLRRTWIYWAAAAIGLTIWLLVPKKAASVDLLDLNRVWQNIVYFAQGFAYPVAPLAIDVANKLSSSDLNAIVISIFPWILAWSILGCLAGKIRLVVLSIGWFIVAAAPACLMLGFDYVIDGPRLLYTASVGAALFWTIPLDVRWHTRRRSIIGTTLAALVVVVTGFFSYRFIHEREAMYEQMRRAVSELELTTIPENDDKPILLLNFPAWLAPKASTFLLGHEGVTLLPEYSTISDLLWLQTGEERKVNPVVLPDLQRSWVYHYVGVGKQESIDSIQAPLRAAQKVILTDYTSADIRLYEAGALAQTNQTAINDYQGEFADSLAVTDISGQVDNTSIIIELHWLDLAQVSQDVTVFLHLVNAQGQLVAQADGYPLMGMSRIMQWQPGDNWRDMRILPLPGNLTPGRYLVKVGIYPTAGGPRLSAVDGIGQSVQDDALPILNLDIANDAVKISPLE